MIARFLRGRARRLTMCLVLLIGSAVLLAGCQHEGLWGTARSSQKTTPEEEAFAAGANLPPRPKTLYSAARMLAARGQDAESEFVLTRLIREHPRFMPAYCDLAELQMRQRHIDGAIEILSAGLRLAPRDAILRNNLGMCRMIKGEYEEALREFTRAAADVPHNPRYRTNMATVLGLMGRYEEAMTLYEQVCSLEEAEYNLGVLHEARQRLIARAGPDRRPPTVVESKPGPVSSTRPSRPAIARSRPAAGADDRPESQSQ